MFAAQTAVSATQPRPLSRGGPIHGATGVIYSRPANNFSSTAHTIPLATTPMPQYNSRAKTQIMINEEPASPVKRGPHPFLRSSFKIGSTHGRTDFEADERVFHRSDVPEKARQAHAYITQLLQTHLLSPSKRNWDSSITSGVAIRGSKHCSWETALDKFDDRYYHKVESDAFVEKAKRRVDQIRQGIDPDYDPHNINPRWNVSTFIEEKNIRPLSATRMNPQQQASKPQPKRIKHLPADHKTLVQLQTELNLYMRELKASDAEQKAAENELKQQWAAWLRSQHIDGDPQHPQLEQRIKPNYAEINDKVSAEYPSEALTTFLWQAENPEAAAAAGLAPQRSLTDRSAAGNKFKHAPKNTVHHTHRTERPQQKESLPYSSAVPPAWYRAEARTAQIAASRAEAPFPKFAHPGVYGWVEAGTDGLGPTMKNSQEHKEWAVGDEISASGGTYRWNCCLHPLRDARGCTAVDSDPNRRRIVVARSDDPYSVAAKGLCGSKIYTTRSLGLDASHVRARSDLASAAVHGSRHAAPVGGGTAAVSGTSSGMGLSGPGVAIVKRFQHSGRYEPCKATKENMWSCCGASAQDAQGCTSQTVTTEHRWMVDSQ